MASRACKVAGLIPADVTELLGGLTQIIDLPVQPPSTVPAPHNVMP